MPKPWLKLWGSSLDSEKIQSLTGDQVKTWLNLLWIALRYDKQGELPALSTIAFQGRMPADRVESMIQEQVELGLVEKRRNRYVVHDWEYWQGDGKSDAQRKREQRDRDKKCHVTLPVTSHVTENGDVTASHAGADRAKRERGDGEGEEKTERETEDCDTAPPSIVLGDEYTEVGNLAMHMGADISWGIWVSRQGFIGHPAAWIRHALEHTPADKFNQNWIAGKLRGYKRDGGPPKAPKVKPAPKPPVIGMTDDEVDEMKRKRRLWEAQQMADREKRQAAASAPKPTPAPVVQPAALPVDTRTEDEKKAAWAEYKAKEGRL